MLSAEFCEFFLKENSTELPPNRPRKIPTVSKNTYSCTSSTSTLICTLFSGDYQNWKQKTSHPKIIAQHAIVRQKARGLFEDI
jgi:hypothetical protein